MMLKVSTCVLCLSRPWTRGSLAQEFSQQRNWPFKKALPVRSKVFHQSWNKWNAGKPDENLAHCLHVKRFPKKRLKICSAIFSSLSFNFNVQLKPDLLWVPRLLCHNLWNKIAKIGVPDNKRESPPLPNPLPYFTKYLLLPAFRNSRVCPSVHILYPLGGWLSSY